MDCDIEIKEEVFTEAIEMVTNPSATPNPEPEKKIYPFQKKCQKWRLANLRKGKLKAEGARLEGGKVPQIFTPGFRLVDLNLLAATLRCQYCSQVLSLADTIEDSSNIFKSVLKIKCANASCSRIRTVPLSLLDEQGRSGAYSSSIELRDRQKILVHKTAELTSKKKKISSGSEIRISSGQLKMKTRVTCVAKIQAEQNIEPEKETETFISNGALQTSNFENVEINQDDDFEEGDLCYEGEDDDPLSTEENIIDYVIEEEENSDEDDWFYTKWVHPLDVPYQEDHFPQNPQKCHYCSEDFLHITDTQAHMRKVHPEYKNNICGFCKKHCGSVAIFRNHLRVHFPDTHSLCFYCGKMFVSPSILSYHMEKHVPVVNSKFRCKVCRKKFKTKARMAIHMDSHGSGYTCDFCSKVFKQKERMKKHLMDQHLQKRSYECNICGASFVYKYNRDSHVKNNHNWVCLICNDKFTTGEDAKIHVQQDHSASEVKECSGNGPAYEKVTRFQCDICCRCLATKQSLDKHKLTHNS